MFKFFIFLSFFFSHFAFSQELLLSCPSQAPTYHLEMLEDPLVYDMNLYSKQIPSTKYHENSLLLLGSFNHFVSISSKSSIKGKQLGKSSCTYISDLYITLRFKSIIYISREAQLYTCTYNRVLTHEQTHYKIQKSSLEQLSYSLRQLVGQYFDNIPVNYNEQFDFKSYFTQQNQLLKNDIQTLLDNNSNPYHAQLDTLENYNRESNLCSLQENILLSRELKK